MSDDTKNPENRDSEPSKSEGTPETKPEKAQASQPYAGESQESVTKIERPRRSEAPDTKDEPPAAKKPARDVDDSPTLAQSPLAKSEKKKSDEASAASRRPPSNVTAASSDGRRVRASGENFGALLVLGGVLVVGNIALRPVSNLRYDATSEQRYTLSKKGTTHLLSTLTKPLHMTVYTPEGLATVDAFVRDLRDLLDEYKRLGNGKVDYEIVIPDRLEGEQKTKAEADAAEAGLKKQVLGEAKGGSTGASATQATIGQGYLGMVITYGGEKEKLDQAEGFDEHNPQGLEFLISNKIREVRDKEDKIVHQIGFLQGHKEKSNYQQLSKIFTQYFPYYSFQAVDLKKGEQPVSATLDGLIITQPDEEITTKELRRIDEFLMKGKSVAVFANTIHFKDADASMTASFNGMGIEKLLAGYGIDFKPEMLVDQQQFWTPIMQGPAGLGIQLDPYPFIFVADGNKADGTVNQKFPPFNRQQQILVPFPEEITIDKARAGGDGVTVETELHTTPNIITIQGTTIAMAPNGKLGQGATGQKQEKREAIIAVDIEGAIKSAFPGGGEGVDGVPVAATGKARLFVLSASDYLSNPFQEAGKSPFAGQIPGMDPSMGADEELMRYAQLYQRPAFQSGIFVIKQTCDWLSGELDLLATTAKMNAEPELSFPHDPAPSPGVDEKMDSDSYKKKRTQWLDQIKTTKNWTFGENTLAGGVLLGLYGIFRWWKRNSDRASVKI